jgi:hypothetical protein
MAKPSKGIPSRQRRQLIKALGTLGAGLGMPLTAFSAGNKPVAPGMQRIKGDVKINGQTANLGMLVKGGDTVVTGKESEAIYVIGQDAYLQRESSTITHARDAMRVLTGKILSVFGKGRKQISVPTATIGIRGTACYIETEGEGLKARTYFCLCYGAAEVTPAAAPEQKALLVTGNHEVPHYIHNDPGMPRTLISAPIFNHTDLELEMLEALVGRMPNFPLDAYGQRAS